MSNRSGTRIRWYPLLKERVTEEGVEPSRIPALLKYEEPELKTLIVCQELEKRSYAKFPTYLDFGRFFWKEVMENCRCFYEIIFGDLPQKPYFDLDIPLRPPPRETIPIELAASTPGVPSIELTTVVVSEPEFTLTIAEAEVALLRLTSRIREVCPQIREEDIQVFFSHGPKKRSYHVVVDNWCFSNCKENRAFHDEVMRDYPEQYSRAIDHTMYKSIQQFRTYLSHKYQSARVKTCSELSRWEGPEETDDPDLQFIQTLGASLVTNTSYCMLLPSFVPPEVAKPIYEHSTHKVTMEHADEGMDLCREYHRQLPKSVNFPFKVVEIKERMVMLKRQAPSHCPICDRSHEHDNPYLSITGSQRNVYFHCRRSGDQKGLLVGSLGVPPSEIDLFLPEGLALPVSSFEEPPPSAFPLLSLPRASSGPFLPSTPPPLPLPPPVSNSAPATPASLLENPMPATATGIQLALQLQAFAAACRLPPPPKVDRFTRVTNAVRESGQSGLKFNIYAKRS